MDIYRVSIEGPDLDDAGLARIAAAGWIWERTWHDGVRRWRHWVRLRADGAEDASTRVLAVLGEGYSAHDSSLLLDSAGEPWRGPFDRDWKEVDWSAPELCGLSTLQRAVIGGLLDGHEPAWTILRDPAVPCTGAEVEATLGELERLGLVDHTLAASGNPDEDFLERVPWWALTLYAWDLLGLIASPRYRAWSAEPDR